MKLLTSSPAQGRSPGPGRRTPRPPSRQRCSSVSHYKSNIRDIEFNLFEVLDRDKVLGTGPFEEVDLDTARTILTEVDRMAREDLAASYEDSDRNPPVFDPQTGRRRRPGVVQEVLPGLDGLRVLAARHLRRARRHAGPLDASTGRSARWCSAPTRPIWMYGAGPMFATVVHRNGNERDKKIAQLMVDKRLGRHDGAHRARRRLRRRRRPHQGHAQRRRLLEHRGRQALHHLGRERPERQHHPPRARPPRRASRASAARAPRASRSSSCRSSTSTPRPVS